MTICRLCGKEFEGSNRCPVCELRVFKSVGTVSEEQEKKNEEMILAKRKEIYKDTMVYIRGYHFEEENGELVEKFHQDVAIAKDLHQMNVNDTSWSNLDFAKHPVGESVDMTVVVDGVVKKELTVSVVAPETEGAWKIGLVIKPGLEGCIRVGNDKSYADSQAFSLKG